MEIEEIVENSFYLDDDILFTIQFDDLDGEPCIVDIMKNNTPGYYDEDTYMLLFDIGGVIRSSLTVKEVYKSIAGKFSLGAVSLSNVKKIYCRGEDES